MIKTTREQRETLLRKWKIANQGLTYREFRKTVVWGLGYIMVPWCGMMLGIEPDGYAHT